MEEQSTPVFSPIEASTPSFSPVETVVSPIANFFNLILFVIILGLVLVFIVIVLFAQGVNYLTGGPTQEIPTVAPAKEGFLDGPPYPNCKTDGALAMF
jgi:hypothetical protein